MEHGLDASDAGGEVGSVKLSVCTCRAGEGLWGVVSRPPCCVWLAGRWSGGVSIDFVVDGGVLGPRRGGYRLVYGSEEELSTQGLWAEELFMML